MRDIECRRVLDRVFWFVGVKSLFSLWMGWVNLAVDSGQLWDETIVKERKKRQEMLLRVVRALPVALGRIIQRV